MHIKVESNDLFSTRIWHFDVSELQEHFEAWQQALLRWRESEPTPAGRSNRQGWNSAKTLFDQPQFAPLLQASQQAFIHAIKETAPGSSVRFRLEAWANIHDPGSFNMLHVHESALMSGCFYLTVPEGAGPIVFRDPRPGALLSPFIGAGANNGHTVRIMPKAGTLLLFPNWLDHCVEPNEADTQRHSIGINAIAAV